MLDRCDRVQIAVHDAAKAAQRFSQLLGCEIARRDHCRHLAARRTILAVGESEFELCEPDGAGLTQDFLARRGEGLMTAGYCTADLDSMAKRWEGLGIAYDRDAEQLYLESGATFGLPIVISESTYRPRVGPVSFLYETTNTLISDWRRVAAVYAGLFGLDPGQDPRTRIGYFDIDYLKATTEIKPWVAEPYWSLQHRFVGFPASAFPAVYRHDSRRAIRMWPMISGRQLYQRYGKSNGSAWSSLIKTGNTSIGPATRVESVALTQTPAGSNAYILR